MPDKLQDHRAVISGSFPLYLALRNPPWTPGDIDVYIGADDYDTCVAAFINVLGAVEIERETRNIAEVTLNAVAAPSSVYDFEQMEPSFSEGVDYVRRFRTTSSTFDLIKSVGDAIWPIASFHSTVVMNLLTSDVLIIGAPAYTLYECGLQSYGIPNPKTMQALQKYEGRGFCITYLTTFLKGPGFGKSLVFPLPGKNGSSGAVYESAFTGMWERIRAL